MTTKINKLTWQKTPGQFTTGEDLYLGNIPVGRVWELPSRVTDGHHCMAQCLLPGSEMERYMHKCKTMDEAKAKLLAAVNDWIAQAEAEYTPEQGVRHA